MIKILFFISTSTQRWTVDFSIQRSASKFLEISFDGRSYATSTTDTRLRRLIIKVTCVRFVQRPRTWDQIDEVSLVVRREILSPLKTSKFPLLFMEINFTPYAFPRPRILSKSYFYLRG